MQSPMPDAMAEIPEFRLAASTGQTLSRESFAGKVGMVFVFLADLESHGDRALEDELNGRFREFGGKRTQLLGVAKATARAVRSHADQFDIKFPILADASGAMRRSFSVEDKERVAVVADKEGRVVERIDYNPTDDDADVVVTKILQKISD